ncbi:29984_t:CDS:2, partial [Gigaspora margarita]
TEMLDETSENLREKKIQENIFLSSYWSKYSDNQDFHTNDYQNFFANDNQNFSANDDALNNIVNIENEIENNLYETTNTTNNIVDNKNETENDLYEATSTTNIVANDAENQIIEHHYCYRRRYE